MTAHAVQTLMAEYLTGVGARGVIRATHNGFEVGATTEDVESAFDAFQACADHLAAVGLLDPTRYALTWLGKLDIVPADFIQLRSTS